MTRYILLALALVGCNSDDEIKYNRFNGDGDTIEVEVGTAELLDPVEVAITSSTNEVDIGIGWVDPGGGPIGTDHGIVVEVFDEYEADVDRVSVRTRSPSRGTDEYNLTQDSADEGVWKITLTSEGEAGESRTDTLTFLLWEVARGSGGS
jgi:hypothetical protein